MSATCYKCDAQLSLVAGKDIGRSEECPSCYANLRCCMMCEFYDKSSYNECREPTAERILEKEKANFCDHFKLSGASNKSNEKEDLLSAADALFKK
jgi:uncharacterized Fe-S cluster-containing radical SAM superfamily protein